MWLQDTKMRYKIYKSWNVTQTTSIAQNTSHRHFNHFANWHLSSHESISALKIILKAKYNLSSKETYYSKKNGKSNTYFQKIIYFFTAVGSRCAYPFRRVSFCHCVIENRFEDEDYILKTSDDQGCFRQLEYVVVRTFRNSLNDFWIYIQNKWRDVIDNWDIKIHRIS